MVFLEALLYMQNDEIMMRIKENISLNLNDISIGRITKLEADIDAIIERQDDTRVLNVHYLSPFWGAQYLKSLGFVKDNKIDTEFDTAYFARFNHPAKGRVAIILDPRSGFRKGFSFSFFRKND